MNYNLTYIRFSSWRHPSNNWKDLKWLLFRLELLLDLTLPSLQRQKYKKFDTVVLVDPDSSPEISQYFHLIEEAGAIVCPDYNSFRKYKFEDTKCSFVYEARQDSDDLIAPDVWDMYTTLKNGEDVGYFRGGYYYEMKTKRLLHWDYPKHSAPQFMCYRIRGTAWAHNRSGWFASRGGGTHTAARFFDDQKVFPGRHIMVLGSGTNASNQIAHATTEVPNRDEVLDRFGVMPELQEKYKELANGF